MTIDDAAGIMNSAIQVILITSLPSVGLGLLVGLIVGDIKSAVEELKSKDVKIYREIQTKEAGKNAIVVDPDNYMISLFEPNFSKEKDQQTAGYVGFTPA